ncbi:MAG: hypothetical protein EZS26_000983 [Candidatus Ordinivivax streblomastigis]|uniref:Uncharacterized protein n=1 Tax=Candidatus Ordinivivax streblomastigis TaxID=2540710 RepID=A0A5M8P2Y5_9BACT|nr:MAG: hypothetical protein EZS26_000983 [Candidatus Ordinivivax streblomastigis]
MNNQTKQQISSTQIYNQILHKVNCQWGAPMGRLNVGERKEVEGKRIYCRRVYLMYDGAYDKGGAYWGCGAPLYVEFTLDKRYVRFFRN